jgi:bifunctional DNA-binding transcriptional regulator/antitoxin component of YhaV-PrlF toxin-antitoxin module
VRVTIDSAGRIAIPDVLLAALHLTVGATIDISQTGDGLLLRPDRTARLGEVDGALVVRAGTVVTDDDVLRLIDEGRR